MSIFTRIWEIILMISGKIWEIVHPALEKLATEEGEMLLAIASKWVVAIANDTSIVTNDDKRKAAFDAILEEAKTKGINIAKEHFATDVYNAIQFAYTKYITE
jgi:hypothetical protein